MWTSINAIQKLETIKIIQCLLKITRTQDVCVEQINTITMVKYKNFICKEKRKKAPMHQQGWEQKD